MAKRYPKQARDLAVALYLEDLSVPEITKRFNEGTAGLTGKEDKPLKIAITERRVAEYVAEHKAKHGPRPEPEDQELTADSINRVKQRALNVLAREIAHLEGLPKGRIQAKQSTALRQHYATLDDMERRAEIAEKRRAKGKGKRPSKNAGTSNGKGESAIEQLAKAGGQKAGRQGGHESAVETPQTETQREKCVDPFCPCQDGDPCNYEDGKLEPPTSEEITLREEQQARVRGLSPEELEEIMGSARA